MFVETALGNRAQPISINFVNVWSDLRGKDSLYANK